MTDQPKTVWQRMLDIAAKAATWFVTANLLIALEIWGTWYYGPWLIKQFGERMIPPAQAQVKAFIAPLVDEQFGLVDERLDRSEKMLSRLEKLFPRRAKDGPRDLQEAIQSLDGERP